MLCREAHARAVEASLRRGGKVVAANVDVRYPPGRAKRSLDNAGRGGAHTSFPVHNLGKPGAAGVLERAPISNPQELGRALFTLTHVAPRLPLPAAGTRLGRRRSRRDSQQRRILAISQSAS